MAVSPIRIKIFGVDLFSENIKKINKRISGIGKSLRGVGRGLTVGLSAPIGLAGLAATKFSMDFNEAMANVGTLIPGQTKRLQELKKGVQQLSIETGKSTDDLAKGLFQVISAFGDSPETLDKLRTNARGAVAGVADVSEAINLTSLVTKNFGDVSDVATKKVLNLAFKANELGQTTFPEMAASMGPTVPMVKTLGVSMEELFGVMGTFTGVTGNTSEVVTQLRSFLGALLKPTGDMEIAFKKLGVRSGEELIRTKGLQGSIKSLVEITKPYPGILAKVLGRKEALTFALAGAGELSETFATKTQKMMDVVGSTEKAFKEQTEGINKAGFSFKQFTRRLVVMAQNFGDAVAPALMMFLDLLSPLITKFSNLSPGVQKFIFVIGTLVAAIGPLLVGLGAVSIAIGAISLPVVAIIAGILALGAAIAFLIIKWKMIMAWIKKIPTPILFLLGPLGLLIKATQLISDNWDTVVSIFKNALSIITKLAKAGKDLASSFVGKVAGFFGFGEEGQVAGRKKQIASTEESTVDNLFRRALNKLDSTLSKVEVSFRNAPDGTNIQTVQGGGNLEIENGLATAGN